MTNTTKSQRKSPSNKRQLCSKHSVQESALAVKKKKTEHPIIEDPKTKFKFTYDIAPQYRTFNTASEGQIRGIKYKLIPVGHSVPGACSVLLTLPDGKRILYTGDVRFHGAGEVSIDEYVRSINGPVDVLITEGTRIGSDEVITEEDVGKEISADIGMLRRVSPHKLWVERPDPFQHHLPSSKRKLAHTRN